MNLDRMSVPLNNTEYSLLMSTSIFSDDRRAISSEVLVPASRPVERTVIVQPVRTDAPIFRGVTTDENGTQAVLEVQEPITYTDPTTNRPVNAIKYNALTRKAGDTFQWNSYEFTVLDVSASQGMDLLQKGAEEPVWIAMGHNVFNEAMAPLPDKAPYSSADVAQQNTGYSTGRGARGGRNARGATGATAAGGMPGVTAGMTPITAGSTSMAGLQAALLPPAGTDPPLPPGSTDDLEARMKARRASQDAVPVGANTISPTTVTPAKPAASAAEVERQLQARRDAQLATPASAPAGG